ncbi:MAG: DEAD/DEAH box helicase, partial [Bacilli bacterium]
MSYLLHLRTREDAKTPALVVAPTSVIGNWQKEFEHFAPSLRIYVHYGSNRIHGESFANTVRSYDVVITTYALTNIDQEDLKQFTWQSIILDEAQNIKNDQTLQSQAIRALTANHHVALSGTPIENRLTELWALFDFINSGYLGTRYRFMQEFIQPIEKDITGKTTKRLKALIQPFFLRRTKKDKDVQLNLPDKQEQKEFCHLTSEQATLYEAYVKETFSSIEKLSGFERRGKVL